MDTLLEKAPTVATGLIESRSIVAGMLFKEYVEARIPGATQATADIQSRLDGVKLLDCRPILYKETFRNTLVEGTGALVLRCTVLGPKGKSERLLWINNDHRAGLDEDTITFTGRAANESARVGDVWEVTHLTEESALHGITSGREAFALAPVVPIRPAGEEFALEQAVA